MWSLIENYSGGVGEGMAHVDLVAELALLGSVQAGDASTLVLTDYPDQPDQNTALASASASPDSLRIHSLIFYFLTFWNLACCVYVLVYKSKNQWQEL